MVKGNQSLVATDRCLTTLDMRVKVLHSVCAMVCELSLMFGAEIQELLDGWKETDIIHGRIFKKVLRVPRFAANGVLK
jgi:hypothetical protein